MKINIYKKTKQKGSTLLLGLLVVSTIGASVFILGSITIRTLKVFRSAQAGEVAYLGADAGLEKGLWAHARKRSSFTGNCDSVPQVFYPSTGAPLSGYLSNFTNQSCKGKLLSSPAIITINTNQTQVIYIADYDDLSLGAGYTQITLTWQSGSGTASLCSWDNTNCSSRPLNASNTTASFTGLSILSKYVLSIAAGAVDNLIFAGQGYNGSDTRGLPADRVTIQGAAGDGTTRRKVEIRVAP